MKKIIFLLSIFILIAGCSNNEQIVEIKEEKEVLYSKMKFETPTLYISHGSPRNVIAENCYTDSLEELHENITIKPKAILVISAHWITKGTYVSDSDNPETIYDFYGFPDEMYNITYNAKGNRELSQRIAKLLDIKKKDRGFDHGAWTILKKMYPNENIPVVQLSIDYSISNQERFEIGKKLKILRNEGVLIIGSGALTHNLRDFSPDENATVENWAKDFDLAVVDRLNKFEFDELIEFENLPNARRAHPNPDHYWPLMYVLGSVEDNDKVNYPYEGFQHGTMSMRNIMFK